MGVSSALIFLLVWQCCGAATCPPGWTARADSCYVIIHKALDWFESLTACQAVGGALVEIESRAENDFITSLIQREKGADAWIGLYDFLIERDFVWLSTRAEPDFTHWGHAEPDNYNEQDCVRMLSDGYWDDVGCGESRWPVCEMTHGGESLIG